MVTINLRKYSPEYYKEDTFMDVKEDVAEFLETNRPKPAIAKRKAQRYKAQYSLDSGDGIEEDTLVLLFEEARRNELLYERLRSTMACLTEKQRRRFLMKYDLEYTYAEIAEKEQVNVNAVEDSIEQAREKIKKYFLLSFCERTV